MKYLTKDELNKLSKRPLPNSDGDGRPEVTAYKLFEIKQL